MKKKFASFIQHQVPTISKESTAEILTIFHPRSIKKGTIIKKAHTKSKEIQFMVNGVARLLVEKENGDLITVNIFESPSFFCDFISQKKNKKTPFIIEAVEDCEVLTASSKEVDRLLQTNIAFNSIVRESIAEITADIGDRLLLFLTSSAKERYQNIIDNYPELIKKYPLHFIASMIGITPVQLSRIRSTLKS